MNIFRLITIYFDFLAEVININLPEVIVEQRFEHYTTFMNILAPTWRPTVNALLKVVLTKRIFNAQGLLFYECLNNFQRHRLLFYFPLIIIRREDKNIKHLDKVLNMGGTRILADSTSAVRAIVRGF